MQRCSQCGGEFDPGHSCTGSYKPAPIDVEGAKALREKLFGVASTTELEEGRATIAVLTEALDDACVMFQRLRNSDSKISPYLADEVYEIEKKCRSVSAEPSAPAAARIAQDKALREVLGRLLPVLPNTYDVELARRLVAEMDVRGG